MEIPTLEEMPHYVVALNPDTGKYESVTDKPFLLVEKAAEVRDRISADRKPSVVYDSRGIGVFLAEKNAELSSTKPLES